MRIERRKYGYWIADTPEGVKNMGPYRTKQAAQDDLRGVKRFLREEQNATDKRERSN